jgi:hypothetical protein
MNTTNCPGGPSPEHINNPEIVYFEPTPLIKDDSIKNFTLVCPHLDGNNPVCCNDDQVEILGKPYCRQKLLLLRPRAFLNLIFLIVSNFAQIDTVFGNDCPICGINLKRMWCDYTCAPNKTSFSKLKLLYERKFVLLINHDIWK